MTIALEDVKAGDWEAVRRTVDALRSLVLDTGGASIGIRFGVTTISWAGGTPFSSAPTVLHGLGKTPVVVIPKSATFLTGSKFVLVDAVLYTSTDFTIQGVTDDRSNPAAATTCSVVWVAIG